MAEQTRRDSPEARALVQRVVSLLQPQPVQPEEQPSVSSQHHFTVHLHDKRVVVVDSHRLRELIEQEIDRELGPNPLPGIHMPNRSDLVQAAWFLVCQCHSIRHDGHEQPVRRRSSKHR